MSRNRLRGIAAAAAAVCLLSGLVIAPGATASVPYSIEQKVTESGTSHYGVSTAVSGNTAVVGSYQNPEAAYVYVRSGDTWVWQATLASGEGFGSDWFGISVDIDGDTAVVGASQNTHTVAGQGAAYVFVRSGGLWSLQQKLVASDAAATDNFGTSVALSGDTIVVGAPNVDTTDGGNAGAAYVYSRSGSTWSQVKKLIAAETTTPGAAGDGFGYSVALSGDRLAVGVPYADPGGQASAGRVYTYARAAGVWSFDEVIAAATPQTNHYVGQSVALDGATLVTGAFGAPGAAYVHVDTVSGWVLQQTLLQPDYTPGDYFGYSVGVCGDTAVIGAQMKHNDTVEDAGALYVFSRSGASWTYLDTLIASGGLANDRLGAAVCVGPGVILGGADWADAPTAESGAAYFFSTHVPPVPVYRFYNAGAGTHFYTASEAEKNNVQATLSHIFTYEGPAYYMNPAANTQNLHRFYHMANGTHFYTANETEKANVQATLSHVYQYEGPAYKVSTAPGPGRSIVYRFYHKTNGTHFYTASEAERANVQATLSHVYTYEGPAFWVGQ